MASQPRRSPAYQEQKESLEELELEMDQETRTIAEGLAIRAGIRWREQGDATTKYFFRQLTERRNKTAMRSLVDTATGEECH
ncbi:MAG: hypothetical protein J3R72DRAFT_466264, partial [Linnemannia gamsii]